ncbi:MAG: prolipoprotein diacylglyceryl transferase [Clostridia bacterium]|nr:prolipoprotein diacylglyceryl transferase [Clostridia bacterium]
MGIYGLFLVAACAVGLLMFGVCARHARISVWTVPVLAVLGVLLGVLCSRLYLHTLKYAVNGFGFEGFSVISSRPYEYAMCGTLLGVVLAGVLTARMTKQSVLKILDAIAPAGLAALAVSRFGEHFSDFGWGQIYEDIKWQFFPVGVQDIYGQWHFAVYMLEGIFALLVCVRVLRSSSRREGERFWKALLWLSVSQILCESLRAETIRWGFVRVQQLQCVVFIFLILIVFSGKAQSDRKLAAWLLFVFGVGIVAFMEYALDKIDALPNMVCYLIMASAVLSLGYMIERLREA